MNRINRDQFRPGTIPRSPGVYVFRDRLGEVIYIGKAKILRRRLSSYFQPSRRQTADARLRSLINSIQTVEIFPVGSNEEALLLESKLIKQFTPRYNILLRDDKRFLLIRLDPRETWPRLSLVRIRRDDGCRYFGPFTSAGALRATVEFINRRFGLRSCNAACPGPADNRHCHRDTVRFCSAPCTGAISKEEYQQRIQDVLRLLKGGIAPLVEELQGQMRRAAEQKDFERAAELRDILENLYCLKRTRRDFSRPPESKYPRAEAVDDLQRILNLPQKPERIECFDISNLFGSYATGSMVVFQQGAPARKSYRRYRIREIDGIDDFAMIHEVVHRRYQRLLQEKRPLPNLIIVDGGLGQLHAAKNALTALNLNSLSVIGLAKKQEEIFQPGRSAPIHLPEHAPALHLLQAIRDEAHRFAITFHRELRNKRIQNSILDEIPGIGPRRKQQLLREFGSVRALRRQSASEIVRRIDGFGIKLAEDVMRRLQPPASSAE